MSLLFAEGFGFIECDDAKMRYGMDVFIHRRSMTFLHFRIGLREDLQESLHARIVKTHGFNWFPA